MGVIAQRAALICLLFSALIILAWTQLERLLLLLGKHYKGRVAFVVIRGWASLFACISGAIFESCKAAQMVIAVVYGND